MEENSVSYDELKLLFHWGEKRIELTEQLDEFIKDTFHIKDLKERFTKNQSKEHVNFPITIPKSKIEDKILNTLNENLDLDFSTDALTRIKFSMGMSYWDLIRLRNGKLSKFVDGVVFPKNNNGLKYIIKLANEYRFFLIPSGGRTSVTEAIEPKTDDGIFIAVNLVKMNRILKFLPDASLLQVESGLLLPNIEHYLKERNFKFGHSPQSFMYTSIGGAIGARGAGQFSSLYGNIKEMIHDMTIETSIGTVSDRKILTPESAVGSNITDLLIGSEGSLGIISEVYLKIKPIQSLIFSSFLFKTFEDGVKSIKTFYQLGLKPLVIRLSDKEETKLFLRISSNTEEGMVNKIFKEAASFYLKRRGFITDHQCLLILIFEGEEEVGKSQRNLITKICKKNQGISIGGSPAKSWYEDRYQLPHYRSNFMEQGLLVDTLETAATWDKLPILYKDVNTELKKYCKISMAHISHVYKEGAAIYFTFLNEEDYNWENPLISRIRNSVIPIFNKNNATISHHHGVGGAFKKFLDLEKDLITLEIFKSIKQIVDPNNIFNPSSGLFL
ncbi:MAG: FAD-binding oxidoreductase [Promethearchaeota archaeon]|jgi:alkyldihydroxyacetonephosphate synthase